jgi:hypothetical protein
VGRVKPDGCRCRDEAAEDRSLSLRARDTWCWDKCFPPPRRSRPRLQESTNWAGDDGLRTRDKRPAAVRPRKELSNVYECWKWLSQCQPITEPRCGPRPHSTNQPFHVSLTREGVDGKMKSCCGRDPESCNPPTA